MKTPLFLAGILIILSGTALAQDDVFEKDIRKMLAVNGSVQSYDMIFNQLLMQMKSSMPDLTDEVWQKVKEDVFAREIKNLENQLIPVYKKHFTPTDIQAIIAFYETEAGKNLAQKTPLVTQESMMIGQQWGMSLGMAIQDYLRKNGYVESKSLLE